MVTVLGWVVALGNWLGWAYQLEFAGHGVHIAVWISGLLWVLANAVLLRELVRALN